MLGVAEGPCPLEKCTGPPEPTRPGNSGRCWYPLADGGYLPHNLVGRVSDPFLALVSPEGDQIILGSEYMGSLLLLVFYACANTF